MCLLKLDFTLDLFDHVMNKRGKLFIGNFSPETRSERRFRFPRFEETYSSRWIALSHLYTPIQLGDMLTYANTPKDMAADQRMALKRGALYYHYCGGTGCPTLSSKMFPFTPVELHGGWLVGKERILTAVSGEFGWRGESPEVDVFVFDELGREVLCILNSASLRFSFFSPVVFHQLAIDSSSAVQHTDNAVKVSEKHFLLHVLVARWKACRLEGAQ